MPQTRGPLGEFINAKRIERGLSWRRLSYKAKVSPETVSMLVRREGYSQPRAETLRGIARALNVPYLQLLTLAGHLDPPPEGKPSPEVAELVNRILEIYQEIKDDPEAVQQMVNLLHMQAEVIRILVEKDKEVTGNPEERREPIAQPALNF